METCAWACLSYLIKSFEFRFPEQQKESAFVIFVLNFGFFVGCKRKINENERNCVIVFSSFLLKTLTVARTTYKRTEWISFVEHWHNFICWTLKLHENMKIPFYPMIRMTVHWKLSDLATGLWTGTWNIRLSRKMKWIL